MMLKRFLGFSKVDFLKGWKYNIGFGWLVFLNNVLIRLVRFEGKFYFGLLRFLCLLKLVWFCLNRLIIVVE